MAANATANDHTILTLEVPEKKLTFIKEYPQRTLADLFSDIGGYLSLLVGCSVITLCEFFEFIIDFFASLKNGWNRKKREDEEEEEEEEEGARKCDGNV